MNLLRTASNKIKTLIVIAALALLAGIVRGMAYAAPDVVFNNGQNIDGIGNESDFLRINNANGGNVAEVCEDGAQVKLWFYVHNTNPTFMNGTNYDGAGVAKNTVVDIDLDEAYSKNHVIDASVTADNAAVSKDGVSINCGDREIQLEYVSQNLIQDSNAPANVKYSLEGSILNNAKLGFDNGGQDLLFPGCFEYRAYIEVVVKVSVKEEPVLKPAVCENLLYTILANNQVRVDKVEYTANDATVNSVTINYGDGNTSTTVPETHTYDKEGEYTITATLNTTFNGQSKDVTSPECKAKVTVKKEKQPEYACEMFVLKMNDRTANVSFKPVASNGAVFKNAQINFYAEGNSKNEVVTDKLNNEGKVTASFTYAEDAKNLEVIAKVRFNIGEGKDMITKEVTCSGKAVLGDVIEKCPVPGKENLDADDPNCKETPTTPPTTIPDTGAGSLAGIFTAVTAVGAVAHRKLTLRRQ